jgi:hypothetical protein
MNLRACSLLLVAAALSLSGCRMCCPSYDYCGPTEPGESNDEYCGMARRGSIFSSAPVYTGGPYVEGETVLEGETIVEDSSQPVAPPTPPAPPPAPKAETRSR